MSIIRCLLIVFFVLGFTGQSLAVAAITGPESFNMEELPEWRVSASSYGKLLLSDSPEMVPADGIMYGDKVTGDTRLFFHHVNATKTSKKIVVVLENGSAKVAHVTVYRYGVGGGGYDWMAVGKQAQAAYLAGSSIYVVDVPPKGAAPLSTILGDKTVKPNMLVNGIFDFITDQPVNVKVMMMPVNADMRKFARKAPILPRDQYPMRGTFDGANRILIPDKVYDPQIDGPIGITLADNEIDPYVEGVDATDGSKVVNYGNYGVVYKLFLPSAEGSKLRFYLNPRGGVYAGAVGVKYRLAEEAPILTPVGRTAFGDGTITDYAAIGKFTSGESFWLTFSPPGASNLPVKLVILPN